MSEETQKLPAKTGRKSKMTPRVKSNIISALARGLPPLAACHLVGVSQTSLHRARHDDDDFEKKYLAASAAHLDSHLQNMERIARETDNDSLSFKASESIIDKRHQKYYRNAQSDQDGSATVLNITLLSQPEIESAVEALRKRTIPEIIDVEAKVRKGDNEE
tara:strand:- start:4351 stop:4836 length:486 start_codon:yes stop_codon:yes gene_type:complete